MSCIQIIAEVGLNHGGDFELAKFYVNQLIETDIDAITFQIREDSFYANEFENSKLSIKQYEVLKAMIHKGHKKFGLAICDPDIAKYPEPDFIKILSKDLDNLDFLSTITNNLGDKPIFLSTGLGSFETIENALNLISEIRDMANVKIIHTRLSNSTKHVNLKAILSMKERFGNIVAFGNHCFNPSVLLSAVAYEPTDVYFYVKHKIGPQDNNFKHPDDLHAVYLQSVQELCCNLWDCQVSLGTGTKEDNINNIEGQK